MESESLLPINGTSNYNPSLTHSQSDSSKKQGEKSNSRKSITARQNRPCGNLASNTGLNFHKQPITIAIDYFQGLTELNNIIPLRTFLETTFNDKLTLIPDKSRYEGRYNFKNVERSKKGLLFCWNVKQITPSSQHYHCFLLIPGQAISTLSLEEQHQLCCRLSAYSLKATRIDIAFDDRSKTIRNEDLIEACEQGNIFGFEGYDETRGGKCGEKISLPTIRLGSEQSDSFARFYNTKQKHGFDAQRLEYVVSRSKAQSLFDEIINHQGSEKELARSLANTLFDSIGFVHRTNSRGNRETRLSRCPILPWWKTFTEYVLFSCNAIAP
ncbi:MAG: replication initiation factor domain-containing protein [Xenococcaceae cyanobacterium]